MNIPQGYKQTELGIIPEDWEVVLLGSGLRFQTGYPFQSSYFNGDGMGVRLIRNRDLKSDDSIIHYSGAIYNEFIVNNYDILIGMDGDFMPCVWDKGVALLNQRVGRLVVKNDWSPRFLYYAIQEPLKQKEKGTGATTVKHLSHSDIERILMSIPPSKEQRAIAEALSDVDGLIAALDKKIAKKRLLKQGAMQQLLTGKKRLPGFTDEWVEIQVKELGKWSKGQPFSKDKISADGKNSCIHYGELFSYGVVIENVKSNTDVKPSVKSSGKDVLFPASDVTPIGLGRCSALNVKNVLLGGDIIILEVSKDCPAYISYVINLNKQQIIDRVTGTTVKHINSTLLGEIKISISTSIKEQQAIATILSDMDKEIADLEAQRDKYRLLKSGMMQKLLTGQVRLKNNF